MFPRVNRQTVCKPGAVPPTRQTHGRGWPFIWDVRCRTPRATDPSGGTEGPPGSASQSRYRLPLLLGLAPGGVYPAAAVAGGAVRSYRTISPLPPAVPKAEQARRCVSVALSLGSPPPGVTRHRTSVEPGLSSPCRAIVRQGAAIRPSGWDHVGSRAAAVKVDESVAELVSPIVVYPPQSRIIGQ